MWGEFDARIDENERDRSTPLRKLFFEIIRGSGLRPGQGVTKKMLAFEFGSGERLLWEIEFPARNFYLHKRWSPLLDEAGLTWELRPYNNDMKDGGRHSGLSREWSFRGEDCVSFRIETPQSLQQLLDLLLQPSEDLRLNPASVTRWIGRLREFFPNFVAFNKPDPEFDSEERSYKIEIANELKSTIETETSDQGIANAIYLALTKSNLLGWRTYWPMSPKGDADRDRLIPGLAALARAALGAPKEHASALESFVGVWLEAVPKATSDQGRQIAEFLFLHLSPSEGIYIRSSVRQALWLESVGTPFPQHLSMSQNYSDEVRFMRAVRRAFDDRDLAPRDMIDIQSALWVIHSYEHEDDSQAPSLTRESIESAMDAFDRYKKTGDHSEIFDNFGQPTDYWVRSSRNRVNQVYPTKPIVAFLLKKTELNGGWRQRQNPAARLHNSGFIIVDRSDQPIAPPEQYKHLIRGAERVRRCASNYFLEPARENGLKEVSIRVDNFAKVIGEFDERPVIISALASTELQKLGNVPKPIITDQDSSSSTVFTYRLSENGQTTVSSEPPNKMMSAINLILYGPPGTGKTYRTAWEAVRICIGEDAAGPLQNDRDALMVEYRRLASEGRIEFVTFHQSFSYEDFVEGLRPTTETELADDKQSDIAASGGFSLKAHAGVFKVISERARLDTGNAAARRLDRSRPIYKIALGERGRQEDRILEGLDQSLIHIGWGGDIDWSDDRFDHFEEIRKEWNAKKDPDASGKDPNIEITFAFRSGLQIGDYVVISDGRDSYRAFGKVTGEYEFDPTANFYPHRRRVEWIWRDDNGAERAAFYPKNFRQHSAYRLDSSLVDWDALETVVIGPNAARPVASARSYAEKWVTV